MLEIIALVWLWRVNGANARAKGQSAGKYRFITFALWFGLEILGTIIGVVFCGIFIPEYDPFMISYFLGVFGAFSGGFLSYKIAKNCPQAEGNNQQVYTYNDYQQPQYEAVLTDTEVLKVPATIRIIEELGGYGAVKDQFYLNGKPICALAPGMGFEFKTTQIKNIITIGTPYCDASDSLHSVRFIASDDGIVEVHAAAGQLIPELFKNYIS